MQTAALNDPTVFPTPTSLSAKLLNTLVSPVEVFEEVAATPPKLANWLVPTLLICFSGLGLMRVAAPNGQAASVQLFLVSFSTLVGTFWSAFVLWFIGRVFLKTRFPFRKALEVVALTGAILALGSIVTALLIETTGDTQARPGATLFISKSSLSPRSLVLLGTLDVFHLWTTTVLAIGLSKLSAVSFKEAAFWVFGYWVLIRVALVLLA